MSSISVPPCLYRCQNEPKSWVRLRSIIQPKRRECELRWHGTNRSMIISFLLCPRTSHAHITSGATGPGSRRARSGVQSLHDQPEAEEEEPHGQDADQGAAPEPLRQ